MYARRMSIESIVATHGLVVGWALFLFISAGPLLAAQGMGRFLATRTQMKRSAVYFVYSILYIALVILSLIFVRIGYMALFLYPIWTALYVVGFEYVTKYIRARGLHTHPLPIANSFKFALIFAIAYGAIMASVALAAA
jgi:hypothetical protein